MPHSTSNKQVTMDTLRWKPVFFCLLVFICLLLS